MLLIHGWQQIFNTWKKRQLILLHVGMMVQMAHAQRDSFFET